MIPLTVATRVIASLTTRHDELLTCRSLCVPWLGVGY